MMCGKDPQSHSWSVIINANPIAWAGIVCITFSVVTGCHRSDSDSGGSKTSAVEHDASDFALAEMTKHWTKNADGWITAKDAGSSFAPVRYLREVRDLSVDSVESSDLSDADRLNGFEWAGTASMKKTPCREAGEPGVVLDGMASVTIMRRRGQWSQWIDYQPEPVRVQKVKGKWQVQPDNGLLTGATPTPQDYANAGVK